MLREDNKSKTIEEKINVPIHIRKRIFEEGIMLYSKDMYHLLTLGKETDLEYAGYKRYREYYNKAARERLRKMKAGGSYAEPADKGQKRAGADCACRVG